MANSKISQLPNGNLTSSTIFPIVTNGITSKTTFSEIQSAIGSGGSQNLQSVLDNGNTATFNITGNQGVTNYDITEYGFAVNQTLNNNNSIVFVVGGEFGLGGSVLTYDNGVAINSNFILNSSPKLSLSEEDNIQKNTTTLEFKKPLYSNCTILIPTKTTGTYTLATLDDIDLVYKGIFNQTGLDNPNVTEFSNRTTFSGFNFTRISEGVYTTNISGNYMAYINVSQNVLNVSDKIIAYTTYNQKTNNTEFFINTYSNDVLSDNVAYNTYFEIGIREISNP